MFRTSSISDSLYLKRLRYAFEIISQYRAPLSGYSLIFNIAMTFGEKIKEARLAMNLSQTELAQMTGISERSLYTYEQLGTLPRKSNIRKLAEALHISVSYLLDESETDSQSHIDQDMFILEAKENFGSKGAKEAQEVLGRVNSLFAGGELDEDAKDVFFQAIMSVYMDSKKTAREKYTPKKYRKHKDKE